MLRSDRSKRAQDRTPIVIGAAAAASRALCTFEALETRILFGYYSKDPGDEQPPPYAPRPVWDGTFPYAPAPTWDGTFPYAPPGGWWGCFPLGYAESAYPVRYSDGHPIIDSTDLSSDGFGMHWGHTRSWTGLNNGGQNGNGWTVNELPYVVFAGGVNGASGPGSSSPGHLTGTEDDDRLSIVAGAGASGSFSVPNAAPYDSFPALDAAPDTLVRVALASSPSGYILRLTKPDGSVTEFFDVKRDTNGKPIGWSLANDLSQRYGRFRSYTAANGKTLVFANYDSNGYLDNITRAEHDSSGNITSNDAERYVYDYTGDAGFPVVTNNYVGSGTPPTLLARVTLERSSNGGVNWTRVRRTDYTYYSGQTQTTPGGAFLDDPHGRLGDLKLATTSDPSSESSVTNLTRGFPTDTGATATATTSAAHGYKVGDLVAISGANQWQYNGTVSVTAVTSTTFSYKLPHNAPTPAAPATGTIKSSRVIDVKYYRYYKLTGESEGRDSQGLTNNFATTRGPAPLAPAFGSYVTFNPDPSDSLLWSGLKTVVEGESFARLIAAFPLYQSAHDADIKPYVNNFFKYERWGDHVGADGNVSFGARPEDGNRNYYWRRGYRSGTRYRVIQEVAQSAGCSTCSGGLGTFLFEYAGNYGTTLNGSTVEYPGVGFHELDYNTWRTRTTEYLPDTTNTPWSRTLGPGELTSNVKRATVVWPRHGFSIGEQITVAGATNSAYNGTFTIKAVTRDAFEYWTLTAAPSPATGTITVTNVERVAPAAWGDNDRKVVFTNELGQQMMSIFYDVEDATKSITSMSLNASTLVVTATAPAHGFNSNDEVMITGVLPHLYNAAYTITKIDNDTFSFSVPSTFFEMNGPFEADPQSPYLLGAVASKVLGSWRTFSKYDGQGRLVMNAHPSAVTGHFPESLDLVNTVSGNMQGISDASGLIETYQYYTSSENTATETMEGGVTGYFKSHKLQRGESGTAVSQLTRQYFVHTTGGVAVHPLATETVYRNPDGTGAQTTTYGYTWHSGTNQIESIMVTAPTVTSGQNGPGSATSEMTFYDIYSRPAWFRDGDGFITRTKFDMGTGAVTEWIADVNTATTSDEPAYFATPSGGGLHLTTTIEVDGLGRTKKLTDPSNNVTYTVYNDADHEVRVYRGWQSATNTTTGPVQVVRQYRLATPDADGDGRVYNEALTFAPTSIPVDGSGRPTGTETISASNIRSLSRGLTNNGGQVVKTDDYFSLNGVTYSQSTVALGSASNDSATGNRHRSEIAYDGRGQAKRLKSSTGTITRTLYDGLSRATATWVGTDDEPTSGSWSPTNNTGANMVKVASYEYDNGGIGDGNLTKATLHPGGSATDRVTSMHYDWRNRPIATKHGVQASESSSLDTQRQIVYRTLDNLGQVTAEERYDGDDVSLADANSDGVPDKPSDSTRRAKTGMEYDEQGRLFRNTVHSVDQSTGAATSGGLTTNVWFDRRGNVIKISAPSGLVTKTLYDGANRATIGYATDGGGDSAWGDADDVLGDKVLEQFETTYDANGNPILSTTRQRFHDATETGALGDPSSGSGTAKARVSYAATYYDAANRPTADVNVGTNGGSAYTRPSTAPARSDTVLVNSYVYDDAGRLKDVTDPRGIVDRTEYDLLGRTKKVTESYVDGTPSSGDDRVTEYTYNGNGDVLTMKAMLPGTNVFQETKYIYGVSQSNGSDIDSNDILAALQYPDKTSGSASSGEQETCKVNALGETKSCTDRNGNVHTYTYDALGRLLFDEVTTLGSGVDGAVRKLGFTYDTAGRPEKFTTYNASGGVVNEVQRAYNGFGQLVTEYQEHGGSVNTSTSPKVQYAYTELTGGNHSRLKSVTYPNGRILRYEYSSGLDDTISRLSFLADDNSGSVGTHLEEFSYLGVGTIVSRYRPQPDLGLTYIKQGAEANGDAGDPYTGLDRFGRIVDQRWLDGAHSDRFTYGYDRNGNRLYEENLLDSTQSELYHGGSGYDLLDRLTSFSRGTLDAEKDGINGTASRTQSWTLDALGNWSSVSNDGTAQSRTHNSQNQLTQVGSNNLAFDGNGSLTTDDAGRTLTYDAWSRLVSVTPSGGSATAYAYDALGRRATQTPGGGSTRDLYYSDQWQVLEERVGGTTKDQYVWSPVYIDAMVLRDCDADGQSGNGLEQRLYVQHDANFNVTALTNTAGNVVERYVYDPYGAATILTPSWSVRGTSAFGWQYLHQGGRYDAAAGLYHFRNRDYNPTLGRWVEQDPKEYIDGSNLYQHELSQPTGMVDPFGTSGGPTTRPGTTGVWVEQQTERTIPHERVVVGEYGTTNNDGWSYGPGGGVPGGAASMIFDAMSGSAVGLPAGANFAGGLFDPFSRPPGKGYVFEDDLSVGEPSGFVPLTPEEVEEVKEMLNEQIGKTGPYGMGTTCQTFSRSTVQDVAERYGKQPGAPTTQPSGPTTQPSGPTTRPAGPTTRPGA